MKDHDLRIDYYNVESGTDVNAYAEETVYAVLRDHDDTVLLPHHHLSSESLLNKP